jgi:hypothetical protein
LSHSSKKYHLFSMVKLYINNPLPDITQPNVQHKFSPFQFFSQGIKYREDITFHDT